VRTTDVDDYLRGTLTSLLDRLRGRTDLVARRHVVYAAARLDELDPSWWTRVNRRTLDLTDVRRCLLAQVFGGYATGLRRLYPTGTLPPDARAFTGDVAETLWFDEVERRSREAAARDDREFGCVAS
jgi:hypothetical protein